MDFKLIDSLEEHGCEIRKNEEMKNHTSFKVGGPADRFIVVKNMLQLRAVLNAVKESDLQVFILGNGSNILVSDKGIRGVVLSLSGDFKKIELLEDNRTILCASGVRLSALCKFAKDNSLTGLEFAWGIPGSVGGAAYMNAGAYGGEMKDVVREVMHISRDSLEIGKFNLDSLDFSYRHSVYTNKDLIITAVKLRLDKGNQIEISSKMDELMKKRKNKQPYDMPSAGSTFKRPQGAFAAALIEECGLKGERVGNAMVSDKHAGFIINNGGATCEDILALIKCVKQKVFTERGVRLECEVKLIGEGF